MKHVIKAGNVPDISTQDVGGGSSNIEEDWGFRNGFIGGITEGGGIASKVI